MDFLEQCTISCYYIHFNRSKFSTVQHTFPNPITHFLVPRKYAAKGTVSHPGKGECADPVNEDAILERVGGRPPGRNRKRQLASDTGDGKT
jgi:hypothetical protein